MKNLKDYFFSYLKDVLIESRASEFHGELELYLRSGHYMLTTPGAIQSYSTQYYNFRNIFKKINWTFLNGKEVLLLGMGMASVIEILERIEKIFHYTAIEIDEEIIDLAGEYVLSRLKSKIEIILTDALFYLSGNSRKYDLVLIDLYLDNEIPKEFMDEDFIHLITNAMKSNGLFIQNLIELDNINQSANKKYLEMVNQNFPKAVLKKEVNSAMLVSNKDFLK